MKSVFINGEILPIAGAKVSVFDRSYLYGEGAFESFRSYEGKLLFLERHLNRLRWSSEFLHLPFPEDTDFEKICVDLLEKNGFKEGRFKIVLSRYTEDEENFETNLTIFCDKFDENDFPKNYKLKTIPNLCNDIPLLASIKSTNRLPKVLGRLEALDSGFQDGILLNGKGQVTETTSGNLFWIDPNNVLKTVLKDCGILGGIMKDELIKLIHEKKLKVQEAIITPKELSNQKEVFLTNSIVGIRPVVQIDDRQISGGEPGNVTLMLQSLWKKKIEGSVEKPWQPSNAP